MTTMVSRGQLLAAQKAIVESELPAFKFHKRGSDLLFEGRTYAGTPSRSFLLRLELPPGSPDICPNLYVWHPVTLRKRENGTVNGEALSHNYHTHENGPGGRIKICHIDPENWHASMAYVQPLLKGVLWCEAYCAYLATPGTTIADFFS